MIADYLLLIIEEAKSKKDIDCLRIDVLLCGDEVYKEFQPTVLRNDQVKYEPALEESERFLESMDGLSVPNRVRQRAKKIAIIKRIPMLQTERRLHVLPNVRER